MTVDGKPIHRDKHSARIWFDEMWEQNLKDPQAANKKASELQQHMVKVFLILEKN